MSSIALTVKDLQTLASTDGNITDGWVTTHSKAKPDAPSRPLRLTIEAKKSWVKKHHDAALAKDANATKSASERAFKVMRSERARELTEQVGARMLKGQIQIAGASFNKHGNVSGFKVDTPDTARADRQERAIADVTPEEAKALIQRLNKIAASTPATDGAPAIDTTATPVAEPAAGVPEAVAAQ